MGYGRPCLNCHKGAVITNIYDLECFSLPKSDVKSLDFAVTRFLMKLFKTSSIDVINDCRHNFSFSLPSEMIEVRKAEFESKFKKMK